MSGPRPKWQSVQRDDERETLRLKTPGGWIYLLRELAGGRIVSTFVCYVPDDGQIGEAEQRRRVPR